MPVRLIARGPQPAGARLGAVMKDYFMIIPCHNRMKERNW